MYKKLNYVNYISNFIVILLEKIIEPIYVFWEWLKKINNYLIRYRHHYSRTYKLKQVILYTSLVTR